MYKELRGSGFWSLQSAPQSHSSGLIGLLLNLYRTKQMKFLRNGMIFLYPEVMTSFAKLINQVKRWEKRTTFRATEMTYRHKYIPNEDFLKVNTCLLLKKEVAGTSCTSQPELIWRLSATLQSFRSIQVCAGQIRRKERLKTLTPTPESSSQSSSRAPVNLAEHLGIKESPHSIPLLKNGLKLSIQAHLTRMIRDGQIRLRCKHSLRDNFKSKEKSLCFL
ncbi:hypothetical protein FGO68_gene11688 [Halteria grandinella]|uniref:Uncharacterized protein n=1 Tax=Halteria grandinella TaxID=5974 RepID=A0A8J8T015_HALGN|nr:hypothetical protein FGO68_gene11688 [Halteria grandinella]